MKAKYLSILTIVAAIAALVSCTKDPAPGKVDTDQPAETLRTITVSFDVPTKSYLYEIDGTLQPLFTDGDSILVSNGEQLEICRVRPKETQVTSWKQPMTITTKLEGPLTAVYPYTAAQTDDAVITGVNVPSEQSGSFAEANICMANQEEVDEVLTFETTVGILRFYTKDIAVDTIKITSSGNPIASEKGYQITLAPKQPEVDSLAIAQQEMGHQVLTIEPDYWYAAIDVEQGNVRGMDLTFESVTHTQDATVVKQSTSEVSLIANTMYNVFIPYYIKVQVGYDEEKDEPIIQRWAYCNIGAFTPEDQGEYFMWGEEKGHRVPADGEYWGNEKAFENDFKSFVFEPATRYLKCDRNQGFADCNAPYFDGATIKKYTNSDNLTTLTPEDDAATANWGDGWRMPTEEEFKALLTLSHSYGAGNGILEFNDVPLIFFYAGTGIKYELSSGSDTNYWTSTINKKGDMYATALATAQNQLTAVERYKGCPIRPIYEKPTSGEFTTVTITQYTQGGTL